MAAAWLAVALLTGPDHARQAPLGAAEAEALGRLAAGVTVEVHGADCGGSIVGSGVVLGDRIYTNRHLVASAEAPAVLLRAVGQPSVEGLVSRRGQGLDVAELVLPSSPTAGVPVELAAADAEVGEPVVLAGWVDGRFDYRTARVHLYVPGGPYGIDGEVMLLDRATTFGYSGGPVVNRHGQVVGLLQSVDLTTSLTLAVPASQLNDWIDHRYEGHGDPSC